MAKKNNLGAFENEFEKYFDQRFNEFIIAALADLATPQYSPVYTGLFASSWKADTRQIQKDSSSKGMPSDKRRRTQQPWAEVHKSRGVKPGVIKPRFAVKDYNFKMLKGANPKVFIGNTTDYRNWALGDNKNARNAGVTLKFVLDQQQKIDQIFQEKRPAGIQVGVRPFDDIGGRRATGYERLL